MLETATTRGLGFALPDQVVPNSVVAERLGVDEDWILSRTGIRERRWLRPEESLADLATDAARQALGGVRPDLVIVATCSPDDLIPGLAPTVAERVGGGVGLDINIACTGFLAGLQMAAAYLGSDRADSVLVIGAERLSKLIDPGDRGTAALFADGAGALLVDRTGPRIGRIELHSEDRRDMLFADRASGRLSMAGTDVFKHAVARMSEAAEGVDADLYVFHQANARITRAVGRKLGLDPAKVVDCIETVGNVSAASLPLALAAAREEDRLFAGARVLLSAFGAGFVWGAGVIEW